MPINTALYKRRNPVNMLQLGTGVYRNLRTGEIIILDSNTTYTPEANIPLTENSTFYFKPLRIVKMYDLGGGVYEYINSNGKLVRGQFNLETISDWILVTGLWDDLKMWNDTQNWKDN